MECYCKSNPHVLGYRKRMLSLWNEKGLFITNEQRLVDQANCIRKKVWLTELKLEEVRRKTEVEENFVQSCSEREEDAHNDDDDQDEYNVTEEDEKPSNPYCGTSRGFRNIRAIQRGRTEVL